MVKRAPGLVTSCLLALGMLDQGGSVSAVAQEPTIVRYEPRWDVQQSGVSDDLKAVTFLSSTLGWAAGSNNTILRTTDGGETWSRLVERRDGGPSFLEVTFVNESQGWVRSPDELLFTTNGGQTWRPVTQPQGLWRFGPGAVVGSSRLQVYYRSGETVARLVRTDDGGNSWAAVGGPLPWSDGLQIFFTDPLRGWLTGQSHSVPPEYSLAASEDGGNTWRPPGQKVGREARVQFVNPTTGWVLGEDGTTILASTDAGQTWERQFTGLERRQPLTDMHFLNEPVGHVLSNSGGGQVIRTTDGGWSWFLIGSLAAPGAVNALIFPDVEHGWVVGDGGFIIYYHLVPVYQEETPGPGEDTPLD